MTHRRDPGSLADAISRLVDDLGGSANCAKQLNGISKSQIDVWKNPGKDVWPNLMQAMRLDEAWLRARPGRYPPPLLAWSQNSAPLPAGESPPIELVTDALAIHEATGKILAYAMAEARDRGVGATATPSADQRQDILGSINQALTRLTRLRRVTEKGCAISLFERAPPKLDTKNADPLSERPKARRSLMGRLLGARD